MQAKVTQLAKIPAKTGLRISKSKANVMRVKTWEVVNIKLDGKAIDEVEDFTYLGSNISKDGKARIGKTRTALTILRPIWRSKEISRNTKLRIFNTNGKSVVLYRANQRNFEKTAVLCQQIPEVHHGHPLARGHKERRTVGKS